MDLTAYIDPGLLVLIPILVAIGAWFKKMPAFKDKWIPAALGIISVVFCVTYMVIMKGGTPWVTNVFNGFLQGIFCAATAVFSNQLYKQASKEE